MDDKTKELLAKARKMKKQMEEGSMPFDEVLEENIRFGMFDNFHPIRSNMVKVPDSKRKKKDKDKE